MELPTPKISCPSLTADSRLVCHMVLMFCKFRVKRNDYFILPYVSRYSALLEGHRGLWSYQKHRREMKVFLS